MTAILYVGAAARGHAWARIAAETATGPELRVWPDIGNPADITYLVAWTIPPGLFDRL